MFKAAVTSPRLPGLKQEVPFWQTWWHLVLSAGHGGLLGRGPRDVCPEEQEALLLHGRDFLPLRPPFGPGLGCAARGVKAEPKGLVLRCRGPGLWLGSRAREVEGRALDRGQEGLPGAEASPGAPDPL